MSGKTLSTGTLSLKFMKNAQKSKIELEKADVIDDAAWEMPKKVRDAWKETPIKSSQSITYETSYLPFLFPSLADPDSLPVNGRRVFKKGQEVAPSSVQTTEQPEASTSSTESKPSLETQPVPARRSAISSSPSKVKDIPQKSKISAMEAIRDISGVGPDLRPNSAVTMFVKPADVDEPSTKPKTSSNKKEDIVRRAREESKAKRSRGDADVSPPTDPGSNNRKKRKTVTIPK